MPDKGKGKGKGSSSKWPDKLPIVRPPTQSEQNPFTSPVAMSFSPAGKSSSTLASVGVNSLTPENNAKLTLGSSNSYDSSNNQLSSKKKVLHLDGD